MSLRVDDKQYLADQQEEDSSRKKLTIRDQLQQTKVCWKSVFIKFKNLVENQFNS